MRTDSMGVVSLSILVIAAVLLAETLSFGFMSDDFVLVHRIRTEGFFTSWGGGGEEKPSSGLLLSHRT